MVPELDDQDVDRRIESMMQAKAAELDVLRNDASLNSYTVQVTECLEETYKDFIEMDLQDDFRKGVWIIEAQKFVDASHEHLFFGKALARSQQQQAKKEMAKGMVKVMVKPNPSAVAIIAGTPHPRRDRPRSNPPKLRVKAKARRGFHAVQAGRVHLFT